MKNPESREMALMSADKKERSQSACKQSSSKSTHSVAQERAADTEITFTRPSWGAREGDVQMRARR